MSEARVDIRRIAANAAGTRIRMASEQDEEKEQVSVKWRRT